MAKPSEQEIYNYLRNKPGVSHEHAMGIIANIKAESAFDSGVRGDFMIPDPTGKLKNKEKLVNKKGSGYVYSKHHPTKAGQEVEQNLIADIKPSAGGLFQHQGSRFKDMVDAAGKDWETNWKGQIDFALQEQDGKNYLKQDFTSVADSTKSFMINFERPADQSQEKIQSRIAGVNNLDLETNYTPGKNTSNNTTAKEVTIEDIEAKYGPTARLTEVNGQQKITYTDKDGVFQQIDRDTFFTNNEELTVDEQIQQNNNEEVDSNNEEEVNNDTESNTTQTKLERSYRVYDNKTEKYISINSNYNTETKSWEHTASGETSLTEEEVNQIGGMYTDPLGKTPAGASSNFKEEKLEDGTTYYRPYFGDGNEQTSFQKRFSFFDSAPIQKETDVKILQQLSDAESEKNINKAKALKIKENEKQKAEDIKKINAANSNIAKLKLRYEKTKDPKDKVAYEKAKQELNNINNSIKQRDASKNLNKLVQQEKDLRKQLAEMQKNPDNFSLEDINSIKAKIDKVAIDLSAGTNNVRTEGPFGNTIEDVQNVVIEDKDLILNYNSKEIAKEGESAIISPKIEYTDDGEEKIVKANELDEVVIDGTDPVVGNIDGDADDLANTEGGGGLPEMTVQKGLLDSIGGIGTVASALVGAKALKAANEPKAEIDMPELSDAFNAELYQQEQLSKRGFSPDQEAAARKQISDSYALGIENAVRGTAGDRAKLLAMSGVLDSQRQAALLDFAAKDDAAMQANKEQFNRTLMFKEKFDINNAQQMRNEKMQEINNRYSTNQQLAASAFKYAMDNVNNAKADAMQNQLTQVMINDASAGYDVKEKYSSGLLGKFASRLLPNLFGENNTNDTETEQ